MMEADMRNANAAMAGELYPLAQQKATTVIHEGRDIAAKEVLTYEEHALVKQRCQEMETQLSLLEELAKERQRGTQVSQELASLQSWYTMRVVPFLATHADMGGTLNEAVDFLESHKLFVEEVVNRDASVLSAMGKRSEMSKVEQTVMREFEVNYEKLKDVFEHRVRIGNNFVQVHKFAKDLESSFDALTSLLDTNRDFTNERVAGQVANVFHMIEETMRQEKHDVERFINAAEAVAKGDETLDVSRSVQEAKNLIIDHDHRFTYVKYKWDEWQRNKAELRKKVTTIEEIEMWQEDTWEIIKLLENTTVKTKQESEGLHRRVKELGQTIDQQTSKLEEARKYRENEEYNRRVDEVMRKQEEIKDRYKKLEKKVETIYESFAQQEVEEKIRAPQILTSLKDAQVDEGSRFEFVARIEGEPEPKISWLKDGIDVKNNIDYRQDYINGVASLVIEETFIEDTATYTVRATNAGGVAESSAKLTVKSRSAVSSLLEEEKPRFMKQLTNVQVTEGQTAHLDCVVIGRPEPEVVWFKEEKTVKEDERTHLEFTGDHCSLTIERTVPPDSGMYTAKARNIHGESTNFCQLKVLPKKQPPPTPPKPSARPVRAPSIQTSLATSTWEEGDTAILQIYAQGEPRPHVEWRFNEQPVYTTESVKTEEKEDGWHRLIISPVTPAHTGVYTAVAVNEAGESRTSATLHVVPSTTARTSMHEDMLQEDVYERIGRPTERTEEVVRRESMQYSETMSLPAPREVETTKTTTDKRWVELIEEQMSQPSPIPEPIPATTEMRKKVTEQRWVDQIDEVFERASQRSAEQREVETAETYVKMVDELMRDALPQAMREATRSVTTKEYAQKIHEAPRPEVQTSTTTHVSTEAYHAGQIHKAPQPEIQTTTTQRTEAYRVGKIQEAPMPQVEETTTTRVEAAHIGQIREAPKPKVETTTTTQVTTEAYHAGQICEAPQPKVETTTTTQVTTEAYHAGAYYEASPQPEVQRTTTTEKTEKMYHAKYPETPRPPDVEMATLTSEVVEKEHAATIRKTPVPEAHKATLSEALSVENIAAIRRSPAPESYKATLTHGASLENIAVTRRSPAPEVHRARVSRGASVENIGKIRQSPAPEVHKASVTHGANVENVAAIRRTPAPDTHQATITSAVSVENIAAIGRTPIPESHHAEVTSTSIENVAAIRRTPAPETGIATTTPGSAVENIGAIRRTPAPETGIATTTTSAVENIGAIRRTPAPETGIATTTTGSAVENIGAIRQSEPVHPHTATQTAGVMKENVAQINLPTAQPDKRQFTKSAVPIDRIDDIVVPERVPHTTAEVSQTVTDEGFIRHVDQDFTPTQVTTTERTVHGGVAVERGGKVVKEEEVVTTVSERTDEEDAERKRQLEQLEKMEREVEERLRRGPEVEKRVTQTTSAEGWVQHVEDDMAKPQAVQTTKRYEKEVVEDSLSKRQTTTGGGETTVSTTKKEEEEEERKRMTQSRIPQRTTKVTTTTTADGFVQHVHDEMAQPVEVTSTTTRTEGEDAQWKRTVQTRRAEPVTEKTTSTTTTSYVQMSASRPFEPTTQTQQTTEQREERVVEDESRYRDSFIAASEGEGFWTDGAYTTSPSPPPIPRHRVLEEELREKKITDIGLSRTSSEPQFIRGFHREYTVDEGGSISIECVLVGNPRPKVRFFINDKEIRKESKFVEIVTSGDTYSIVIEKARLEHAGYYKIVAENTRGKTESLTMLHVRPQSLIQHHKRNGHAIPSQKITEYRTPTEHTTVTEEFAMFEYEQRRPQKHETSRLVTPPPAKRFQAHRKDEEMLEHYDLEQRQTAGHPPHFTQTLVAAVAADGETAKFEGIVTGWPAPTVEWTKDGEPFTRTTLPDVDISNIGGRVSLSFKNCRTIHGGKYMCTARNASGVATSSAQLVIRPKTVAPDFIQRLISEEMVEGDQLKWTVRVTGDPLPRVTWLRDGIEIPDCEEVRIIDEGDGVHSLLIVRVEIADSGQFTCLAENVAGEARSTADLVVRQPGSRPGSYFHITKVTQEKQVQGEHPVRNSAFTIENPPLQSAML
ncbi:hypothetical protein Aduo_015757 [Ancylostoma duodenale]